MVSILTSNNFIGCLCRQFWFSFFITLSWNFHTECRFLPCVCQDSFLVVFLGTQVENPYEFLTLVAKVIWRKKNCLTRISLTRNNIFAVLCRFMVTMFITWFRLWECSNKHQQLAHEYLHFGLFFRDSTRLSLSFCFETGSLKNTKSATMASLPPYWICRSESWGASQTSDCN